MKIVFFNTRQYDRHYSNAANVEARHDLVFLEAKLFCDTALLTQGAEAICVFVNRGDVDKCQP